MVTGSGSNLVFIYMANSEVGTLNTTDWKKIGMGALVAIAGALVAYFSENLADVDWGNYAYIAVPAASIILNILRKLLEGK